MQLCAVSSVSLFRNAVNDAIGWACAVAARAHGHNGSFSRGIIDVGLADSDIVRTPINTIDDEVIPILQFVGQTTGDNPSDNRRLFRLSGSMDRIICGCPFHARPNQLAMDRLDDVAALAHCTQCRLYPFIQPPKPRADILSQAKPVQFLESAGPNALPESIAVCSLYEPIRVRVAQQFAVNAGEPFLLDLMLKTALDFAVSARTKIEGHYLGSALTHAMRDVLPRDDQIVALVVFATQDNVGVRMRRVVVIDRHPIELCPQVLFHLLHQTAHERFEIVVSRPIFRRDDEAELVAVTLGALNEVATLRAVLLGVVQFPRQPLAGDAVAFQIPQMQSRRVGTRRLETD